MVLEIFMGAEEKSLNALIVEDSADDVLLLVDALNEGGFEVFFGVADNPSDLEAQLRRERWDVVLCDHKLSHLDAPLALDIVRGHDRDIPFIIVSGAIADDVAAQAMRQGAADFVPKGYLARLAPAVERELKGAAVRRDLHAAQAALEWSSLYDDATGLANRECLCRHLREQVVLGRPLTLAMMELRRLRQLMKTVGVASGNRLVEAVGKRLGDLADGAFVARTGDDLFALVFEGADPADAEMMARGIIRNLGRPFRIGEQELFLTCQMGLSFFSGGGTESCDLFNQAQTALQWAKDHSWEGFAVYQSAMDSSSRERMELERALYRALRENQFIIHYQPQFDLLSGEIVGVEALMRWNCPNRGLVPPNKFIPLLEENQLIVPVGEWAMQAACEANRRWQAAGLPPVRTAVNLSVIQFRQPGLLETVDRVLDRSGLDPALLELEITENIALHNEQETIATLAALKGRGVDLAIDDFGTGYSSLCYLKQFPVDKLKIDQSFVRNVIQDKDDGAIVKAILAMAFSLNLKVIAEGVETSEQADFLRANGCQEVQGFYFGRPMPEEKLMEVLTDKTVSTACFPLAPVLPPPA